MRMTQEQAKAIATNLILKSQEDVELILRRYTDKERDIIMQYISTANMEANYGKN